MYFIYLTHRMSETPAEWLQQSVLDATASFDPAVQESLADGAGPTIKALVGPIVWKQACTTTDFKVLLRPMLDLYVDYLTTRCPSVCLVTYAPPT
jgi:hypothetical protein